MTRGHESEKSAKEKTQTRNRERKVARVMVFDHTQVRKRTPQAANRSFNFRDEKCVRLFFAKTSCSHSPHSAYWFITCEKNTFARASTAQSHNCFVLFFGACIYDHDVH